MSPSIDLGGDFESYISVYIDTRKGRMDLLGRDVSVPIGDPDFNLLILGSAFEMFNLMTLLLAVLDIRVDSLYWFYLWHCVSDIVDGMTRQSGRSWLGIYPSPVHQLTLHWDLRTIALFRRPTNFSKSMALAWSAYIGFCGES